MVITALVKLEAPFLPGPTSKALAGEMIILSPLPFDIFMKYLANNEFYTKKETKVPPKYGRGNGKAYKRED